MLNDLLNKISDDLYLAAYSGDVSMCQTLLVIGAKVNHRSGQNNDTPLHVASGMGRTPIVKLLIDKGASVNIKNKNGSTPIHLASQEGHLATARLLVKSGARADAAKNDGDMAIHKAAQANRHKMLELLVREAGVSVDVVSTATS